MRGEGVLAALARKGAEIGTEAVSIFQFQSANIGVGSSSLLVSGVLLWSGPLRTQRPEPEIEGKYDGDDLVI